MLGMVPIQYNLRSLLVRKTTTIATALGIALVVFVFASVRMLLAGIHSTLGKTGRSDNVLVMSKGTDAELGSTILQRNVDKILHMPGVKSDAKGQLGEAELVVVVTMPKKGTSGVSNVTMRGVPDGWQRFRDEVKITRGVAFRPGTREVVVGRAIAGRFQGLKLGDEFKLLEDQPFRVVGVFEAGGGTLESEVWADLKDLQDVFDRKELVSSVHVRLGGSLIDFKNAMAQDDSLREDEILREPAYYEKQGGGLTTFVTILGMTIAIFFSVGAMIGATITMYASVANRQREIGTLRALGFGRLWIMLAFLMEAIVLALVGGAIGAAASTLMGFVEFSTMNPTTWSEVVFRFSPTGGALLWALIFAGIMGLIGGFLPALRAARVSPVKAMRG